MWNGPNRLLPEFRRLYSEEESAGACDFHFRAAVPTRAAASNKNRSWSWARPAARTALSGPLHSGQKRKRLEDLFPQPPRVARHRMPDPRLHSLIDSFAGRYAPLILLRVSPRLSVSALKTHPHPIVIPKAQPRFPQ
jgi:hypothetical protein